MQDAEPFIGSVVGGGREACGCGGHDASESVLYSDGNYSVSYLAVGLDAGVMGTFAVWRVKLFF